LSIDGEFGYETKILSGMAVREMLSRYDSPPEGLPVLNSKERLPQPEDPSPEK
jgi:hypothetical protein